MQRETRLRTVLFFLLCVTLCLPSATAQLLNNLMNGTNSTNTTTDTSKPRTNPFISEVAGPLLLVTTILFFLSILYVLLCLCLIRCGSVRFDPVHYPDGRIYFCLGVRFLASWCYLPLCGGNSSSRNQSNISLTEWDLRSSPPPPPWLAGDHNELLSSMEAFGIYIPIFDRVGRKKALEAILDHPHLFYDVSTSYSNASHSSPEVRATVMRRRLSSSQQPDNEEDEDTEQVAVVSMGRMICSVNTRNRTPSDMVLTESNGSKSLDDNPLSSPPPQDRPEISSPPPQDRPEKNEVEMDHNLLGDDHASTCPICLDELDNNRTIISNPSVCNHSFHRECLVEWLSNNHASCPCCRMDWVSNIMLWDALRWVLLKEIEEEREKRNEEKRLRRLQRRKHRKCLRRRFFCCGGCAEDEPETTGCSNPDIEMPSVPESQQNSEGDDRHRSHPAVMDDSLENSLAVPRGEDVAALSVPTIHSESSPATP